MKKTWMRAAMGTAVVAGLALAGALIFTTRPALAEMMSGRTGTQMHGNHMGMMSNGSHGAMMQGAHGMMGADMGALHASMVVMHDKVTEALTAAHQAALNELMAAGTLTQAQADQMLEHMGSGENGSAHCDQALVTQS